MTRLTIKDKAIRNNFNAEYAKLADLEDIEEELGIDLITLFKALKNGVYHFTYDDQLIHDYVWLVDESVYTGKRDKFDFSFMGTFAQETLLLEDYGKTRSLDRKCFARDELL